MTGLSQKELVRYNRHIILPEIGLEGQEKLKKAKVLVIGAGGLGCPVLLYLSAAGVGTLGILDFDEVSESNLHRQILYTSADVGQSKAAVAAQKLKAQNPFTNFVVHNVRLSTENALSIFEQYDIVVDGSDNFPTRYLVNDACVITNKVLVFGSIFKFDGQVSVFNYQGGPTYRCLFPDPPSADEVPNCAQVGVLGVLPGLIGTMQANETIKIITGAGQVLSGKLFYFDAMNMSSQTLSFERSNAADVKELIDYEDFCGAKVEPTFELKSMSVDELKDLLETETIQLIDVREEFEYGICHLENAKLIPLGEIGNHVSRIERDVKTVVYCHHGMRSASAIAQLQIDYGFSNLYNLEGGIDEWAMEIDQSMDRY